MDLNYFMPGQHWKYQTREEEPGSTLTILKVDDYPDMTIIHIRIDHLQLGGKPGYLAHLPIDAEALIASVTHFLGHLQEIPSFGNEYLQWQQRVEAGQARYFDLPVREIMANIEAGIKKQAPGTS